MSKPFKLLIVILFLLFSPFLFSQKTIKGSVLNKEDGKAIEFVNIGIRAKEIGTVSNYNGEFSLQIPANNQNDTLTFTCIGFEPLHVNIADLAEKQKQDFLLKEKVTNLNEMVVKPKRFKTKRLGITAKNKRLVTGFEQNKLGYEAGILMKNKKSAHLKKIVLNIALCEYDSVFYRVNVYEENGKIDFESILEKPIYFSFTKSDFNKNSTISLDLENYHIITNGNFLVTLELVKDLGDGGLWFPMALFNKTYVRKTSQGKWITSPVAMPISVIADVEI